jgi:two-component system LytT family response regulator
MPTTLSRTPSRNYPTDIGILIVEDERPARSELKRMLRQLGMTGTLREATSVTEALSATLSERPDLILLDIQMPGGSGFDLLRKLGPERPPVIFTTAHEQFAAKAFDEDAVDYLLKPFDPARLAKALSRLPSAENPDDRLTSGDVVLLKIDGECQLLPIDEIELIEATDAGTAVRWGKSSGIVNRTLQHLEDRLDPALFFRCSREALLNVRAIRETHLDGKGILTARLPGGRTVTFSRRQSSLFRKQHRV